MQKKWLFIFLALTMFLFCTNMLLAKDIKDENLTNNMSIKSNVKSMLKWAPVDWFVYVKTDGATQPSNRTVRIYTYPDVYPVDSGWTLSYEGWMDKKGEIHIYSQDEIIEKIMDLI